MTCEEKLKALEMSAMKEMKGWHERSFPACKNLYILTPEYSRSVLLHAHKIRFLICKGIRY